VPKGFDGPDVYVALFQAREPLTLVHRKPVTPPVLPLATPIQ
jgi:hypothetical protein